jgi:hypothetical protein
MCQKPSLKQWLLAVLVLRAPWKELRRCVRLVRQHDLGITFDALVAHHLAGGRIDSWVEGLIHASERGIALTPEQGAMRDLVGKLGSGISLTEQVNLAVAAGHRDMKDAPLDSLLNDMLQRPATELTNEREQVIAAELRRRVDAKLQEKQTSP